MPTRQQNRGAPRQTPVSIRSPIQSLSKKLLAAGLLVEEELGHGGTVVGLTAAGKKALRETGLLDGLGGVIQS